MTRQDGQAFMLRLGDLQPALFHTRSIHSGSIIWKFDNNYGIRLENVGLAVDCRIIAWSGRLGASWHPVGEWQMSETAAALAGLLERTAALAPYHSNLVY